MPRDGERAEGDRAQRSASVCVQDVVDKANPQREQRARHEWPGTADFADIRANSVSPY